MMNQLIQSGVPLIDARSIWNGMDQHGCAKQNKDILCNYSYPLENGPFIDGLPIKNGDFPWLC